MARDTVKSIKDKLLEQEYIPRNVVYSNYDYGRVEAVIFNIQANGEEYPGEPMVRFTACRTGDKESKVFLFIDEALRHIGLSVS